MIGVPEGIAILLILIGLFYGPKKIPELARSLGKAKSEFKEGKKELEDLDEQS